jgi:hypothetical protein
VGPLKGLQLHIIVIDTVLEGDIVIVYLHQNPNSCCGSRFAIHEREKGKSEADRPRKRGGGVTKEGIKIRNDGLRDEGRNYYI